jgi:hypothetical protein
LTALETTKHRESLQRRLFKVVALGAAAGYFGFHAVTGGVALQGDRGGIDGSQWFGRSLLVLFAVVPGLIALSTVWKLIFGMPDVVVLTDELVVMSLFRARHIRREDVTAIGSSSWRGSRTIQVRVCGKRSPIPISPTFEDISAEELMDELVRWRTGIDPTALSQRTRSAP